MLSRSGFLKSFKFVVCGMAALVAESSLGQAANPTGVKIKSVTAAGNGCPADTYGTYVSDDGLVLTLSFDQFSSTMAAGPEMMVRTQCQIDMNLAVPKGWSYTVVSNQLRGYVNLDRGVVGDQRVFFRTKNAPRTPWIQAATKRYIGAVTEDYLNEFKVPVVAANYSPCSVDGTQTLSLFTDLTLQRVHGVYMDYDAMAASLTTQLDRMQALRARLVSLGASASSIRVTDNVIKQLTTANTHVVRKAAASIIRHQVSTSKSTFATLKKLIANDARTRTDVTTKDMLAKADSNYVELETIGAARADGAAGLMTVDTADASIAQKYQILWKRCA
jgi:hypothetical protein